MRWPPSYASLGPQTRFRPSWHCGLSESRRVDRDVRLDVGQLRRVAPVQPRELVLERELDPIDVAVVGVVDLRRHAADWRGPSTHQPRQQARSPDRNTTSRESLRTPLPWTTTKSLDRRCSAERAPRQLVRHLLDLPWNDELRLESRAVQLAADQLVFAEQLSRNVLVQPDACRRMLQPLVPRSGWSLHGDDDAALIRGLREHGEIARCRPARRSRRQLPVATKLVRPASRSRAAAAPGCICREI